jgi:hypothetical protein
MAIWVLAAAVILALLAYAAWQFRWYFTTLRRSFRSEAEVAPSSALTSRGEAERVPTPTGR